MLSTLLVLLLSLKINNSEGPECFLKLQIANLARKDLLKRKKTCNWTIENCVFLEKKDFSELEGFYSLMVPMAASIPPWRGRQELARGGCNVRQFLTNNSNSDCSFCGDMPDLAGTCRNGIKSLTDPDRAWKSWILNTPTADTARYSDSVPRMC